jgi:hypothetical protein
MWICFVVVYVLSFEDAIERSFTQVFEPLVKLLAAVTERTLVECQEGMGCLEVAALGGEVWHDEGFEFTALIFHIEWDIGSISNFLMSFNRMKQRSLPSLCSPPLY